MPQLQGGDTAVSCPCCGGHWVTNYRYVRVATARSVGPKPLILTGGDREAEEAELSRLSRHRIGRRHVIQALMSRHSVNLLPGQPTHLVGIEQRDDLGWRA